ncbi:hypothetical protein [Picrophilus oshimae]|uniref:Hypothetical membrane protein n=1 Tax=Picrophilus torridus (strain ATCC 700027 / DSM 9790 / JCM 10055 / NBRC 100828 / KAW 2/3) TaxID=1122961 RepID=Q6L0N5_PICTO|nr:hypothetical protein [Picrophilus oshimae]AAT43467.1 hypothetical membrane protein [Picrophilus oshimae DSM 9789]SMD30224.1 hypothetical protein SAMN02745355_0090 [Picrophilus oshimae DSM 9789]
MIIDYIKGHVDNDKDASIIAAMMYARAIGLEYNFDINPYRSKYPELYKKMESMLDNVNLRDILFYRINSKKDEIKNIIKKYNKNLVYISLAGTLGYASISSMLGLQLLSGFSWNIDRFNEFKRDEIETMQDMIQYIIEDVWNFLEEFVSIGIAIEFYGSYTTNIAMPLREMIDSGIEINRTDLKIDYFKSLNDAGKEAFVRSLIS